MVSGYDVKVGTHLISFGCFCAKKAAHESSGVEIHRQLEGALLIARGTLVLCIFIGNFEVNPRSYIRKR